MRLAMVMLVLSIVGGSAAAEPVTALIGHETTDVAPDGVTRIARFQERLYRDDDQVWIERVVPARAAARSLHELDVHAAARWYTRRGEHATVVLVSAPEGVIIEVGPASMEAQDLTDRWVIAAGLVDLASLAPTTRTAPAGARWYERVGTADYMRVLWSERFALPLVIESGTRDGHHVSRTTVQPSTRFAQPWRTAREFRRIDFSDLGD